MSTDDPYRTAAPVASRERVEADETIAGHELTLGPLAPLFWPSELRERLEKLRAESTDEARIELASVLGEAVDTTRIRQQELRELSTEFWAPEPLDDQWGPVGIETAAPPLMNDIRGVAVQVDRDVDVTRAGPRLIARFTASTAPITWTLDLSGDLTLRMGTEVVVFTSSFHRMGTPVVTDTPRLHVRRESIVDDALKLVGVRKGVALGNKTFDSKFFVEGNADFAKALLNDRVRGALLDRGEIGDFALWLDGDGASLEWKGNVISGLVTPFAFTPSVDLLIEVRKAFRALNLLRV